MGVEIIKCLKKILKGVSTLQGVVFNHHTRHEAGGGDEIATLVGVHHTTHENGGGDEISVTGLSGVLADLQNPFLTQGTHANRPAAGVEGRLYFETDTGICYRDNGTTWQERWRLETATRLAQLAEKAHNSLTNVTASQHHTKTTSSEISLADLAEKAHSSLTGVTASQHHTKTSNLSEITIDANKNWAGKNITNFGTRGYNLSDQLIAGISFNLGLATVGTKLAQALIPGTFSISKVILYADNAPIGADLIVDINKNGTTIFTTQANRPKISAGSNSGESGTPNITSINKGDRLSVDTDQVGSTTPGGNDLLVTIIC